MQKKLEAAMTTYGYTGIVGDLDKISPQIIAFPVICFQAIYLWSVIPLQGITKIHIYI